MGRWCAARAATACLVGLAFAASCAGAKDASTSTSTSTVTSTTTAVTSTTAAAPVSCPPVSAPLRSGPATLTSGGAERTYVVTLPPTFDPRRVTRVILDFHGSGSDMNQELAYSGLATKGGARGYVVVTPDGTGARKGWALGGDVDYRFADDLLAVVGRSMCIDPSRIYTAGISNGSAFSALLVCRSPYRFAAVAMVAATLPSTCPAQVRPPAIAFHGTADPIVPFTGGTVQAEGGQHFGTTAPGAEGAIAKWAEHNGCGPTPANRNIGTDVIERRWTGCGPGADVTFYRIEGGGHTWPGSIDLRKAGFAFLGATTATIDATALMLDFFDAHPKQPS